MTRTRLLTLGCVSTWLIGCGGERGADPRPMQSFAGSGGSATQSSGGSVSISGSSGAGGASLSAMGGAWFGGTGGTATGGNAGAPSNACSPTTPTTCGAACVNTATDLNHCGGCNRPCTNGTSCVAGACGCPTGQTQCNGQCLDVQSDAQNCGSCGNACATGLTCGAGKCGCANGKSLCGASCTDLTLDATNCGGCGTQCAIGQACSGGSCTASSGGATGPDGCSGLAANVTLSSILAYQSVEIPLMKGGTEVAPAARNTDVVAGRDTLFRLFVNLGSGWTPRMLSGRVFVDNNGSVDVYSAKKSLTQSSDAANADSTFQIVVPKDKVTATTSYQVELVECTAGSTGMSSGARFPADKATSLGARNTGTLKIKVIPLVANNIQPDTSEKALDVYRSRFLAMYPIANVDISVGAQVTVSNAKDWTGTLDRMRAQRRTDAPANDVYYYGLLKPAATFREACGGGCTAGIGYVVSQGSGSQQAAQRASLGLAFADETSAHTMVHEVGHNHGRGHAPCVPQGGSISGVDMNFPYSGGKTGVYGWDPRSMTLLPPTRTDIMGYCNSIWISDYTYDAILTRVATVNAAAMSQEYVDAALIHPRRVVLLDELGARWGIPISEPSPPSGDAETAEALDAQGNVLEQVEVYRTEISDIDAFSIQVPEPRPGWAAIRVKGASALTYP